MNQLAVNVIGSRQVLMAIDSVGQEDDPGPPCELCDNQGHLRCLCAPCEYCDQHAGYNMQDWWRCNTCQSC